MGSLKPGATYIYERSNGVTYARELGADPNSRIAIGWDYKGEPDIDAYRSTELWFRILKEAETNPTLQQAIERVILLYKLSVSKYE